MKKIFLKYDDIWGYLVFKNAQTKNFILQNLHTFLARWPNDRLALDTLAAKNKLESIEVEKNDTEKTVLFWSRFSFKSQILSSVFTTIEEELVYVDAYSIYFDNRWKEMSKLKISFDNYDKTLQQWKKIREEKPVFIVFSLDDSGPLDIVDVIGKHELSPQDLQDMKLEHEKYLMWQKAENLYEIDHQLIDDVWRSPADSVYDSDIAKYIGREIGFIQHKKYTRLEAIAEFKERLQKSEPVYLAVHWLHVRGVYDFGPLDPEVDIFLWDISLMDLSQSMRGKSAEELIEMADRVLAGEKVQIYSRE